MNILEVQHILAQSTKNILTRMIQSLIRGHSKDATFEELAEAQPVPTESSSWVYKKLHDAVTFEINRDKEVLSKAYFAIMSATSKESADNFIASFISEELPHTVTELEEKQPKSLQCEELWG